MSHPLAALSPEQRQRAFWQLLTATLALTILFRFIGPAQPNIVDFELAGSVSKTAAIISAWSANEQVHAGFSLGIDYLYMPLYSTTIALACLWAAGATRSGAWRSIGTGLAWGLWLAAVFDAIENAALAASLFGTPVEPFPAVAQVCATLKFGLILIGLLYVLSSLTARLLGRAARS
jgi:hypothetical protein